MYGESMTLFKLETEIQDDSKMGYHSHYNGTRFGEIDTLSVYNMCCMGISLFCNVAIVLLIWTEKKAKTTPNITMISICMSDIMTGAFVIPTHHLLFYSRMRPDIAPFICKLHVYVWYWAKTTSVFSILAMVCDRYKRSSKPIKSHANVSGRFVFYLSFVWFFGAAFNIWEIVLNTINPQPDQNSSNIDCGPSRRFFHLFNGFFIVDFIVIFVLPFCVSVYFFFSIFLINRDVRQRQRLTAKRRMMLSISLFFVFYVTQLPYEVVDAVTYFSRDFQPDFPAPRSPLLVSLSYSQGMCNAFVYLLCGTELHDAVGNLLKQKASMSREPSSASTSFPLPDIIYSNELSSDGVVL